MRKHGKNPWDRSKGATGKRNKVVVNSIMYTIAIKNHHDHNTLATSVRWNTLIAGRHGELNCLQGYDDEIEINFTLTFTCTLLVYDVHVAIRNCYTYFWTVYTLSWVGCGWGPNF